MPTQHRAVAALLGRGARYGVATLVQLASAVLVLPVLTRILDPAAFGEVTAVLVVYQLLSIAAAAGLPAAVTRLSFADPDGPGRRPPRPAGRATRPMPSPDERARLLVAASVAVAVVVAAVALATGPWWAGAFSGIAFGPPLALAVVCSVPYVAVTAGQARQQAENRIGAFVATAALASAGAQGAGLVAAVVGRSPTAYLAGYTAGMVVAGTFSLLRAHADPRLWRLGPAWPSALRLALPTVPHSLALYLLASGDRLVLERLGGPAVVGRYQVAYALGALTLAGLFALNNAWSVLVYEADDDDRWEVLARTTAAVIALSATASVVVGLSAPWLLRFAAPPSYDPSSLVPVTAVVAAAAVPYTLYLAAAHVRFQAAATGVLAVVTPSALVVDVVGVLVAYPRFGLVGAAAATVVAYTWQAAWLLVSTRSRAEVRWPWPAVTAWTLVAAAGVAGAVALPTGAAGVAVRLAAGGLVALVALRALRTLTRA